MEVDISNGLEKLTVVGLPDAAVRESGERVRSAIGNSGFFFPQNRLTVNLAPADLRKEGPAYDLPIALGVMAASRQLLADLEDALIVGELGLGGASCGRGAAHGHDGRSPGLQAPLCARR